VDISTGSKTAHIWNTDISSANVITRAIDAPSSNTERSASHRQVLASDSNVERLNENGNIR
jgi:hypothetical protein